MGKKNAKPPTADPQAPAAGQPEVATTAQPSPEASGQAEGNRPVKSFSCPAGGGATIEASVWGKEVQYEGKLITVYNVTVRKSYKKDDGSWGNSSSLRGSEIPIAIHLLDLAARWILNQRTEEDPPF